MTQIKEIKAREILDSRGNPTVEAEIILKDGTIGRAAVPSGASTGSKEALELRDKDKRYLGKGVTKAVNFIRKELSQAIAGFDVTQQQALDEKLIALDGTENKEKFGANALLAVSLAAAKAGAKTKHQPLYQYLSTNQKEFLLPVPMMNIINGGAHADNNLDFQEFMIMPLSMSSFSDALRAGAEVFHHLKQLLKKNNYNTNVGDEGGFAPDLPNQEAAVELILEAITLAGYQPKKDIAIAFDIASNELYQDGKYHLSSNNKTLSATDFVSYLESFVNKYPVVSIEDGMAENDWEGWVELTKRLGTKTQLVGDDLFVTNTALLQKGIKTHAGNAILIKPNQIGTLTETLAAITLAKNANFGTIISHRSGETEDTTIADIAVATNAGQIKTGSLSRTDRVAKYNQLLRIEEQLGNKGKYAGWNIFSKYKQTVAG